jgi:hypothetical protein
MVRSGVGGSKTVLHDRRSECATIDRLVGTARTGQSGVLAAVEGIPANRLTLVSEPLLPAPPKPAKHHRRFPSRISTLSATPRHCNSSYTPSSSAIQEELPLKICISAGQHPAARDKAVFEAVIDAPGRALAPSPP